MSSAVYRIHTSNRVRAVQCNAMSGDAFQAKVKQLADKRRNVDKRRLKDVQGIYNQFKDIARVELRDALDIAKVVVPFDKISEEFKAAASKCKDCSSDSNADSNAATEKASVDSTIDI